MEKSYIKTLKGQKPAPTPEPQPAPFDPAQLAAMLDLFKQASQSLDQDRADRFQKFAESFTETLSTLKALTPILQAIANREDPEPPEPIELPEYPAHPTELDVTVLNPTETVSITRPSWYQPLSKADIQDAIQPVIDALTSAQANEPAIDRVTLVDSEGRPIDLSKLFVQRPTAGSVPLFRGGINQKTEIILDGTVDGVNTTFTIPTTYPNPKSDSVRLFLNGARLQNNVDYTFSGRTFTVNPAPPQGGQSPVIDYEAQ
jgi:hypothetical protein